MQLLQDRNRLYLRQSCTVKKTGKSQELLLGWGHPTGQAPNLVVTCSEPTLSLAVPPHAHLKASEPAPHPSPRTREDGEHRRSARPILPFPSPGFTLSHQAAGPQSRGLEAQGSGPRVKLAHGHRALNWPFTRPGRACLYPCLCPTHATPSSPRDTLEALAMLPPHLRVHTQGSVALNEGLHDTAAGHRGWGHEHLVPLHCVQEGPEGPYHLPVRKGIRTGQAGEGAAQDGNLLTLLAGQGGEGVFALGGCSSSSPRWCSSSSLIACL